MLKFEKHEDLENHIAMEKLCRWVTAVVRWLLLSSSSSNMGLANNKSIFIEETRSAKITLT